MSSAFLPEDNVGTLWKAAGFAFAFELAALISFGIANSWMTAAEKAHQKPADFIEAQMVQLPQEAHLVEDKKIEAPKAPEAVISKVAGKGKKSDQKMTEENQTQAAPPLPPTHGPVALYSPSPVIPEYLRNQNINSSVVIDFVVTAQADVTPRLIGSSGNEELDAIAISAAKKWRFKPAENDHKPIDSHVRLRIIFKVS